MRWMDIAEDEGVRACEAVSPAGAQSRGANVPPMDSGKDKTLNHFGEMQKIGETTLEVASGSDNLDQDDDPS